MANEDNTNQLSNLTTTTVTLGQVSSPIKRSKSEPQIQITNNSTNNETTAFIAVKNIISLSPVQRKGDQHDWSVEIQYSTATPSNPHSPPETLILTSMDPDDLYQFRKAVIAADKAHSHRLDTRPEDIQQPPWDAPEYYTGSPSLKDLGLAYQDDDKGMNFLFLCSTIGGVIGGAIGGAWANNDLPGFLENEGAEDISGTVGASIVGVALGMLLLPWLAYRAVCWYQSKGAYAPPRNTITFSSTPQNTTSAGQRQPSTLSCNNL